MASTEAMRLFVKLLEEEDPAWYSRIPETVSEPVVEVELEAKKMIESKIDVESKVEAEVEAEVEVEMKPTMVSRKIKPDLPKENGNTLETKGEDVPISAYGDVSIYDEWIVARVSGKPPKSRYEHGAAVVEKKMYIFGGNHNGRYLCDIQCLDFETLTWSKVEARSENPAPCAGHCMVTWGSKILVVAGHTKDPSETLTVKEFDPQTSTWSELKAYGNAPVARGGHSATLVGMNLVVFGGQDAKRTLLNDLHILDLETMTWDDLEAGGLPPSPRSDHAAAVHANRYMFVFGGGSHATCFNDLHVLDLQNMEWSKPKQQGIVPSPRAGHAGVTVGENWYIVGGGDNKAGVSETLVLNMSTLVWSVVTTVQGRIPVASEGLSLVACSHMGEDILLSFGGYNGRYHHEVYALKPSHQSAVKGKLMERPESEGITEVLPLSNVPVEPVDDEPNHDQKITEIIPQNLTPQHNEQLLASLRAAKEELEGALAEEELQRLQLKQELTEAETRNAELTKELQSVRGQLASEQSRCFKLEVEIAELRQKLQTLGALQKEIELLQKLKVASEEAALDARQRQNSGSVWGWLAGSPSDMSS